MTDRPPVPPLELERQLAELRPHVAFPPTPALASSVRTRIATQPERPGTTVRLGSPWTPRRLVTAFFAVIIAGAALVAAIPDLRAAVADRLGLDGIRIEFTDEAPTPIASPVGITLLLGEQVSLADAQTQAPYAIQLPADLGLPDEIYLRQLSAGPMVSLLYRPRPGLPEAAETGVGAILMQFPADAHPADLSKRITMGMGSVVEVDVGGTDGYWITGFSEFVIAEDPSASFEDVLRRPSANVLIWQSGDVTYRLETDLTRPDAVSLAESLDPASGTDPTP